MAKYLLATVVMGTPRRHMFELLTETGIDDYCQPTSIPKHGMASLQKAAEKKHCRHVQRKTDHFRSGLSGREGNQ